MTQNAPAAFFSYSRNDSDFVLRLATDLKQAGANVWLDQLDIAPGQRWARAVEDALTSCSRVLVVLSPSSVSSPNVQNEIAFAVDEKKTVIPVFYRDCRVPLQLRGLQYADFRTDYDRGLKALLKTLGMQSEVAARSATSEAPPNIKPPVENVEQAPTREPVEESPAHRVSLTAHAPEQRAEVASGATNCWNG